MVEVKKISQSQEIAAISVCTIRHGTETYRLVRITVTASEMASSESVPRLQAQSYSGFDQQSQPARGRRLGA